MSEAHGKKYSTLGKKKMSKDMISKSQFIKKHSTFVSGKKESPKRL